MADIQKVLEERGANYGAFSGHAMATMEIKEAIYKHLFQNERFGNLAIEDRVVVTEAVSMIAHKLGRIVNGDPLFEDSWVDLAGYASLVPKNTGGQKL